MSTVNTQQALYRPGLEHLASVLGVPMPQVAKWSMIPKGLVLQAAEFLDTSVDDGTAEEQLEELIDRAGLVDSCGKSLRFSPGNSAEISEKLANFIHSANKKNARIIKEKRPSRVNNFNDEIGKLSKLQLVNAISNLTNSGPETLGPGSKERKSVLINLYRGLNFGEVPDVTKTELASSIARRLDVPWGSRCESTGETITTLGLRTLYEGAKRKLTQNSEHNRLSAASEANLYVSAILQHFLDCGMVDEDTGAVTWKGRDSIERMISDGYTQARQTEWPGFYFEFLAIKELMKKFRGGPVKIKSTIFDYMGVRVWDLKTHSESPGKSRGEAILNDQESIDLASQRGIGFMVLSGEPKYDNEAEFYNWHLTQVRGKTAGERSARSRRLKTGFTPSRMDFYYIDNNNELNRMLNEGVMKIFPQGRQTSGSTRKNKYSIKLNLADADESHIYSVNLKEYFSNLSK